MQLWSDKFKYSEKYSEKCTKKYREKYREKLKDPIWFARFAKIVLVTTVVVIAWGAFVRATGSGAGCGKHWPLCNGEVIPRSATTARLIEFSHRLSSGLSLVLTTILVVWSRWLFAKGSSIRRATGWSLVFILGEALVGAMLVLLQLVAGNDSVLRAIVIACHLVNTFLLLYWMTQVVYLSGDKASRVLGQNARATFSIVICMVLLIMTGAAGAIVALGDTLFPATSVLQGLAQDFSPTAHFLIKLRVWHPVVALLTAAYILLQCLVLPKLFRGIVSQQIAILLAVLISLQILGGFVNLTLLAPVAMQLFHLISADIVWITICFWLFYVKPSELNANSADLIKE